MRFERVIKNLSGLVAFVVIFFMAGGMYLSSKGFEMMEDGQIVLVRSAAAQDESAMPAPKPIPDNYVLPDEHAIGSKDAPVTIYEYSSFGCSHCADFHLSILPKIKSEFIDKGLVRMVFVPFPIDRSSMNAALLSECVDEGKYFAFIEILFKKQHGWGLARDPDKVLKQYAALSGLSNDAADACLKNDENAREILLNRQNGLTQLGIQGTPSFVVSYNGHNELISGARSYKDFKAIIEAKLPNIPTEK